MIRVEWLARHGSTRLEPDDGPPLELFQIGGEPAVVGFIESGRTFAHWAFEIRSPGSEVPPGADEAPWLVRQATYATHERLDPAEARKWAEGIVAEESLDDHGAWEVVRPKGAIRTKSGEAICTLAPAKGWPTQVEETILGKLKGAEWAALIDGWHLDQRPSCKFGGPIFTIRIYATRARMNPTEAQNWALETAKEEERRLSLDPVPDRSKGG